MISIGDCLNDRYEIRAQMIHGSLADIWEAFDQLLQRRVAVKTMIGEVEIGNFIPDDLLKHEAKVMAALEHPHLVPVYDLGLHEGQSFTVQRYISTTRLSNNLDGNLLSAMDTVFVAQRIASALDYLHNHGHLHGDLKASNVLLDEQKLPYIANFAVAPIASQWRIEAAKRGWGTLYNLAPEQLQGEKVDYRADLFAFGILLYQCFTGGLPFEENRPLAENLLVGEGALPSVRVANPRLPIGIDLVLNRLTRLEPEQRYAGAGEAVADLTHMFYSGQTTITGRVFISYARRDRDFVYTLAKELRSIGIDIWIDQDIAPGTNWDGNIENALKTCDKMLLILSPAAVQSENVHDEWSFFLEQGKPVYPFIYQECDMSFRLRRRQHIKSAGDVLSDVSAIVDVLAGGLPTLLHNEV